MTTTRLPAISTGPTAASTLPPYPDDWDARLTARGVKISRVIPGAPGTLAWVVTKGVWLDEQQSQGRHHFYADVYADGQPVIGAILAARWPGDGYATFEATVKPKGEPIANFPMSKSLNEFSFQVNEPKHPSDRVTGVGMGANGNSGIHTSTYIEWTLYRTPQTPAQPLPVPPTYLGLVRPCAGTITQRWGENPQDYARFGIPGHNGVDFGNASGTPIRAIADGIVAYMDTDPDYGNYIRVNHPQLGFDSFYAHLLGQRVRGGDPVQQGQEIGMMGSTGNSTGPHLHFEIRLTNGNAYVDLTGGFGKGRIDPAIVYWLYNREVF